MVRKQREERKQEERENRVENTGKDFSFFFLRKRPTKCQIYKVEEAKSFIARV